MPHEYDHQMIADRDPRQRGVPKVKTVARLVAWPLRRRSGSAPAPGSDHHERPSPRAPRNSHTGPRNPADLALPVALHDREGFVPISGIKPFAIMKTWPRRRF